MDCQNTEDIFANSLNCTDLEMAVDKPVIVVPARPTPNGIAYLSNIDLTVMFPIETIYIYRPHPDRPTDSIIEQFKSALSELLVPYYYAAGRLTILPDTGRPYINCNSAGALFAGATSNITIDHLVQMNYLRPLHRNFALEHVDQDNPLDRPLLMVQVTRFKCGGFVLGLSNNHCLFDGLSALQFLQNYASIMKGDGLIIQPNLDRTCLMPRSPPRIDYEHREYVHSRELEGSSGAFSSIIVNPNSVCKVSEEHSYRIFRLSSRMISELKARALQGGSSLKGCSSFEALLAHVWQCRTKSLDMDPSRMSAVLFAVDARKRLQPPLPEGFSGNAVIAAYARASAEEVCNKPLSFCVRKVQEGVERITDSYIRSSIDWLEVNRGMPAVHGHFFVSSWSKIPFRKLDFGWGKAIYTGPLMTGIVNIVLLLASSDEEEEEEGVNVVIVLKREEMAKFEKYIVG